MGTRRFMGQLGQPARTAQPSTRRPPTWDASQLIVPSTHSRQSSGNTLPLRIEWASTKTTTSIVGLRLRPVLRGAFDNHVVRCMDTNHIQLVGADGREAVRRCRPDYYDVPGAHNDLFSIDDHRRLTG